MVFTETLKSFEAAAVRQVKVKQYQINIPVLKPAKRERQTIRLLPGPPEPAIAGPGYDCLPQKRRLEIMINQKNLDLFFVHGASSNRLKEKMRLTFIIL